MLIVLIPLFQVAKTGEMLIMLIMLIPGELWGRGGPKKELTLLNISPVLSTFLEKKKWLEQGKC